MLGYRGNGLVQIRSAASLIQSGVVELTIARRTDERFNAEGIAAKILIWLTVVQFFQTSDSKLRQHQLAVMHSGR